MHETLNKLTNNSYLVFIALIISIVANCYLIANAHRHWNDNKPKYIIIKDNEMNELNPMMMSGEDLVRWYRPETDAEKHMLYLIEQYELKYSEAQTAKSQAEENYDNLDYKVMDAIEKLESLTIEDKKIKDVVNDVISILY